MKQVICRGFEGCQFRASSEFKIEGQQAALFQGGKEIENIQGGFDIVLMSN